jgi:hypothetical protein
MPLMRSVPCSGFVPAEWEAIYALHSQRTETSLGPFKMYSLAPTF